MSQTTINATYDHMLSKCRDARDGGWGLLSTGEQLAEALVLHRADWLEAAGYTIAEAVERIEPKWVALIREVAGKMEAEAWESAPAVRRPPSEPMTQL